jgi:hypothetical protein
MRDARVKKFLRAAAQRLNSAKALAEAANGRAGDALYLDAMYLAGYCAECALKARLLAGIPVKERDEFEREYSRSPDAHDLENLNTLLLKREIIFPNPNRRQKPRKRIKKAPIDLPPDLVKRFRKIWSWSTSLRYESGSRKLTEWQQFLAVAGEVLQWAERSI